MMALLRKLKLSKKLRKGSIVQLAVGAISGVIALVVGIMILGYFQKASEPVISSLNNTEATNAYTTAMGISWSALTLLSVAIIAVIGFGIIFFIFRR